MALLLASTLVMAQDAPTLTPLQSAQLQILELQTLLAQTRQALVRCEANGPQWATDLEQARERAKALVLEVERDHPGWTLDLATKTLVKK